MSTKQTRKKAVIDTQYCAACGVCMNTCPLHAISIPKGIYAVVNSDRCVGCSKCQLACPASTILMQSL